MVTSGYAEVHVLRYWLNMKAVYKLHRMKMMFQFCGKKNKKKKKKTCVLILCKQVIVCT